MRTLPYSVRGGELNPHPTVYPRALSNIAYAYGHIKDTDDNEEEKVVKNVKSSSTTTSKKKWSDEDYEEEDHFFHSLYHNNDEEKVVTNASIKKKVTTEEEDVESEDEVMFKRLNDKIFHRGRDGEEKKEGADNDVRETANMRHGLTMTGLQEVFEEASFFE